jgi:hypothetical protein
MADPRPIDAAIADSVRQYPPPRYWRTAYPDRGYVEVVDSHGFVVVAIVRAPVSEEARDG